RPTSIPCNSRTTLGPPALGADDGGETHLTYTWAVTAGPSGVTFSANGTNAAKSSTATFTQAGTYTFQVTVTDQDGLTVTSQVTEIGRARGRRIGLSGAVLT